MDLISAFTPPPLITPPTEPLQGLSRRQVLRSVGALTLLALAGSSHAKVDNSFWEKPRTIRLYRPKTNEAVESLYWRDGVLAESRYNELCWLLRDVRANAHVQMHPRLLDLLYGIQGYLEALTGKPAWLTVTDAYRTPGTNTELIEEGIPASRASLHMYGGAADLKVSGLSAKQLAAVAKYFGGGGVGVYRGGHVHVDIGRVREWRG